MLFEGRLHGAVFRPIGVDWAEKGFWKVYDHPATVEQFLGIGGATPDGTARLNDVVLNPIDGLYHCKDIEGDRTNKAITLDLFLRSPIDIVIASIPDHIEPFKKLCIIHPKHPRLIYQIGNAWTIEAGHAPNIMASAHIQDVPADINFVEYHQEFDTNIFKPIDFEVLGETWQPLPNIFSFVNVFNVQSHFAADWAFFTQIEREMTSWVFKSYGGQCRDGCCNGSRELADKMREARFIWHTKAGGDGYGHVLYNSAAVGRPLITKKSYYHGKMGAELMIDGETCIDIDNLGIEEIKNKINYYDEPDRYKNICNNVYNNFLKVCNFDHEFEKIKTFLRDLK